MTNATRRRGAELVGSPATYGGGGEGDGAATTATTTVGAATLMSSISGPPKPLQTTDVKTCGVSYQFKLKKRGLAAWQMCGSKFLTDYLYKLLLTNLTHKTMISRV